MDDFNAFGWRGEAVGKTPEELKKDLIDLLLHAVDVEGSMVEVQSSLFPVYVTVQCCAPGNSCRTTR